MVRQFVWVIVFSLLLVTHESAAYNLQAGAETLHVDIPSSWALGSSRETSSEKIYKFIPSNVSMQNWDQMIIVQQIIDAGMKTPVDHASQIQQAYQDFYQSVETHPVGMRNDSGFPTTLLIASCLKSESEMHYIMTKIIKGKRSMFVVQRLVRFDPSKQFMPSRRDFRENILPIMQTARLLKEDRA
ncbi:MAG: hypothetical protein ACPGXY_02265 [Alphaproteobacteria bacterium]